MDIILLLARLSLAVIFALSGLAKLVDRSGSRNAMREFGVSFTLITPFSIALPLLELLVAGLFIPAASVWWGALGALALLLFFTAAVSYHLARGHTPKCNCFGRISSKAIGWPTLARNLTLSALAGTIIVSGPTDAGLRVIAWLGATTAFQRVELSIGGMTVALLTTGCVIILRVLRQQGNMLRRFEELDATLTANGVRASAEASALRAADTRAPDFRLPDLSGSLVTLDSLLASGRPAMLIFSDPECGPCNSILPEVARWQRDYTDKLTVALVSQGTPQVNRAKADQYGIELFLMQQGHKIAEDYRVRGTPCAVLIHPDRTMDGSISCGAEKIRELVFRAVGRQVAELPSMPTNGKSNHFVPLVAFDDTRASVAVPSRSGKLEAGTLRAGETAPAFALPDLNGNLVSLTDFRRQRVLLLFWNPSCGFCEQMLPELKSWEAESRQGGPTLLVVSTGNIDENQALALSSPVLLDKTATIGPVFGIHGAPMAVLLDTEGKVASEVAVGAHAVLALARSDRILN
jgi:peroxiredoxin/uncharacterized membrane protein YphA (DoxX/SURF4 family)